MECNYDYSSHPYYSNLPNYGAPNVSEGPNNAHIYQTHGSVHTQPSYNAENMANMPNYNFSSANMEYAYNYGQIVPEDSHPMPSSRANSNPTDTTSIVFNNQGFHKTTKPENASGDLISFTTHEECGQGAPNTDVTSLTEDLLNASLNASHDSPKAAKPGTVEEKPRNVRQPNVPERARHKARQSSAKKVAAATHGDPSQQPDPFAQWYQMMSQYYNQFYPGYQFPQPPQYSSGVGTSSNIPSTKQASQPSKQKRTVLPSTSVAAINQPNLPVPAALNSNSTGAFDYASYYYQYYCGAAAAAQMWSGGHPFFMFNQAGRQTPRFYHTPHLKAWLNCPGVLLQVLPTRPVDGELARIEILDLTEVANEAIAEATRRSTEVAIAKPAHLDEHGYTQENLLDAHHSVTSGIESPSHLSSLRADTGRDEDEEIRACNVIVSAWDRTDHMFYPGPLNRQSTLKADVLAFLKEKLSEIQDRLPIDWESAGLLISFLETLVKNNGTIQANDLVNLLLEGHGTQTRDLMSYSMHSNYGGSHYRIQAPTQYLNRMQSNHPYFEDSMTSLPPSGRQSPHSQMGMDEMHGTPHIRPASEAGGRAGSVHSLIRRSNLVAGNRNQGSDNHSELEAKMLDRYRELLMHAMPVKALDYACQSKLWGHAFALAHRLGPSVFMKVMDRFLSRALPVSDPILTYYQLTANELPHAVNTAAYSRGADTGEWRPHLAMILASESNQPELARESLQRLGDSLLSRRLVYAAHLCYLLMGPMTYTNESGQYESYMLPDKIWLLGALPSGPNENMESMSGTNEQSPFSASSEAIQLTEIYEYAMQLSNRNYRLPQLLPYRLAYTIRLIDAGLFDKAFRYLTLIGHEILIEADRMGYWNQTNQTVDPILYSLVSNCLRFAEPLQNHPEVDHLDFGGANHIGMLPNRMRSSSEATENWLQRLRDLYRQMNQKLGYCSLGQCQNLPPTKPGNESEPLGSSSDHNMGVKASGEHTSQPRTDTIPTFDNRSGVQTVLSNDSHHTHQKNDPSSQSRTNSHPLHQQYPPDKTPIPFYPSSGLPVKSSPQYSSSIIKQDPGSSPDQKGPWHAQKPHTGDSEVPAQTTTIHTQQLSNRPAYHDETNRISNLQPNSSELPKQAQTQFSPNANELTQPNSGPVYQNQAPHVPEPSCNSPSSQENQFFVPVVHQQFSPSDGSVSTAEPGFDYFAHLRSQQKTESRSRNASVGSQDSPSANHHPQVSEQPTLCKSATIDKSDQQPVSPSMDISHPDDLLTPTNQDEVGVPLSYCSNRIPASDTGDSAEDVGGPGTDDDKHVSPLKPKAIRRKKANREPSKPHSVLGIPSLKPSFLKTHTPELFKNYPCRPPKTLADNPKGTSAKSSESGVQSTLCNDLGRIGDRPLSHSTSRCRRYRRKSSVTRSRNSSGANRSRHNSATFNTLQASSQPHAHHIYASQSSRLSNSSQRFPDRMIKEEYQPEPESSKTENNTTDGGPDSEDKTQEKNGWLSGWFGRLKWNGVKNIHLPDDSKPSIVWDDKLKQWIDVNDPGSHDPVPPPPPPMVPNFGGDLPLRPPNQSFATPPSSMSGSFNAPRGVTRSRYVNILANQTSGTAVSKPNMLQPPLPQTAFSNRMNMDNSQVQ